MWWPGFSVFAKQHSPIAHPTGRNRKTSHGNREITHDNKRISHDNKKLSHGNRKISFDDTLKFFRLLSFIV